MLAGTIVLTALMMLAEQLMAQARTGTWPSITLASQFDIPADRVLSDWMVLNRPIEFVLSGVELWVVMIFGAALLYWLMDWTSEMLAHLFGRRPAPVTSP